MLYAVRRMEDNDMPVGTIEKSSENKLTTGSTVICTSLPSGVSGRLVTPYLRHNQAKSRHFHQCDIVASTERLLCRSTGSSEPAAVVPDPEAAMRAPEEYRSGSPIGIPQTSTNDSARWSQPCRVIWNQRPVRCESPNYQRNLRRQV
jgi:hypothetical protein